MKKVLIIYYSKNGSTKKMAEKISMGVKMIDGIEPCLRTLPNIEDDNKEPGTIVQEIQKGFTIKERLLRPSLVSVSKKTESKDKKSEENKEN